MDANAQELLAERFERSRPRLAEVAYRLLGSHAEAEDAVQETWIRLGRADADQLTNLDAWLTTVVSRVSLNMLRSRRTRREAPLGEPDTDDPEALDRVARTSPASGPRLATDPDTDAPEHEAVMADAVGTALMVVLDALSPIERLAFVLHDMFGVPFEEIGRITERTPAAARQLASRARRRVRGATPPDDTNLAHRRRIVDAFLTAAREGDFETLLTVLDPDVRLRSDEFAVRLGASGARAGASAVATAAQGNALAARPALVDGAPGLVWAPGGKPTVVVVLTFSSGGSGPDLHSPVGHAGASERIAEVELVADPERIARMSLELVREGV